MVGWEDRNGTLYYYEKERRGEKVVSTYIGKGAFARLVSDMNRGRRIEREMKRRRFRERKRQMQEERRAVDEVQELIRALERATLLVNGYHTHKGQWRKRRRHEH